MVVLMVEGTQGIEFLPGVILAVVVANWVAHYIHHDGKECVYAHQILVVAHYIHHHDNKECVYTHYVYTHYVCTHYVCT